MKKWLMVLLCALLLTGCGEKKDYDSRFYGETVIELSDSSITVDGGEETAAVYTSRDIIYHEARLTYDSGNPYGEAEDWERHTQEEAQANLVVNITEPGAYRVRGTLSAGQIRIDLGDKAKKDKNAVAELVLDGADITCAVAPAIVFQNVYECELSDEPGPEVDTAYAGANLILLGENTVQGSHVAKIFKDKEGGKKLWKQDAAIYSYRSMNVSGSGSLEVIADCEGLGSEMHLTINSGDINIHARNDGINTNEEDMSVAMVNGGQVRIAAGLGEEGDGIDSNGYIVINGGTVIASARTDSDQGLDSNLGIYLNGGTVIALGEPVERLQGKQDMLVQNLDRAQHWALEVEQEGEVRFSFDPSQDPLLKDYPQSYDSLLVSWPGCDAGADCKIILERGKRNS